MSSLSQFLASTSPKAITAAGPGSNGYWRREMWARAGAFSFTVKQSGKHKIYLGGAGGGGGFFYPGASAGMSCDERDYVAGDVITITLGAGGAGAAFNANGGDGGSTSVVCAARGLNLVLTGASGGRSTGTGMTWGTATGGNVFNRGGAAPAAGASQGYGGASSASPFGVGFASAMTGGAGWGGPARNASGASSHRPSFGQDGAHGFLSLGGTYWTSGITFKNINGETQQFWDLADIDGGGGATVNDPSSPAGRGGAGAGGGANGSSGARGGGGGLGGGGGAGSTFGGDGGNCAGGGSSTSDSGGAVGGKGGDGLCIIYWDEVQL